MKLVLAVVQSRDATALLDRLTQDGLRVTKLASTGGFLREGNTTLLVGTQEDNLPRVMDAIRDLCEAREQTVTTFPGVMDPALVSAPTQVTVGGAVVFVLNIERFEAV